jgi:hypothetical protein
MSAAAAAGAASRPCVAASTGAWLPACASHVAAVDGVVCTYGSTAHATSRSRHQRGPRGLAARFCAYRRLLAAPEEEEEEEEDAQLRRGAGGGRRRPRGWGWWWRGHRWIQRA